MEGTRGEKIGWFWLPMLALTTLMTGVAAYTLRRGHEPYIYKSISSSNPQIFPFVARIGGTTAGDDMKMLLGTTKEDCYVMMKSKPVSTLLTSQNSTTGNNVQNVLENMVEVMEMEENGSSKDKMLPTLKKIVESVNSTTELQTRMAPQTSNQTIIRLQDTIREFLAISGIDALLPLDCGQHKCSCNFKESTYP